jgi:hypothetical protein
MGFDCLNAFPTLATLPTAWRSFTETTSFTAHSAHLMVRFRLHFSREKETEKFFVGANAFFLRMLQWSSILAMWQRSRTLV